MRILLTAGPTREPIDPVRFLSNASTGVMGIEIARAALARGHAVALVLGPGTAEPPPGAETARVGTALEMRAAVLRRLPRCDAIVCAAAVSDYRPRTPRSRKAKRGTLRSIALVENPDIAAEAGARRGARPLAIFALETDDAVGNARRKLERKNADLCVLNAPEAIGAARARFRFVFRDGTVRPLGRIAKRDLARRLLDEVERLAGARTQRPAKPAAGARPRRRASSKAPKRTGA